jgi:hypothetical protein
LETFLYVLIQKLEENLRKCINPTYVIW